MTKCVIPGCVEEAQHEHHLWPVHLEGPVDGPTVPLCATCHNKIHLCASRLFRGKPAGDYDEVWLRSAGPIISRIVRAMHNAEGQSLDDAPAKIVLEINKRELRKIHIRKIDRGFPSLQAYIMALINADA